MKSQLYFVNTLMVVIFVICFWSTLYIVVKHSGSASMSRRIDRGLPEWPQKFRMDIDITAMSSPEILSEDVPVEAFGTYFWNSEDGIASAFINYNLTTEDGETDIVTYKYVYSNRIWYEINLSTGKCKKSPSSRDKHVSKQLPKMPALMHFEKMTWLRRQDKSIHVQEWIYESAANMFLGPFGSEVRYYHSPVMISPQDPSKCYDIPKHPTHGDNGSIVFKETCKNLILSEDAIYDYIVDQLTKSDRGPAGEPFRLEIETKVPHIARPLFEQYGKERTILRYDLSCVIRGFGDLDERYIFYIPETCDSDDVVDETSANEVLMLLLNVIQNNE